MAATRTKQLVVCVDNEGYAVSLEKRKIYIAIADVCAKKHGMLRIAGGLPVSKGPLSRSIALPQAAKKELCSRLWPLLTPLRAGSAGAVGWTFVP